MVNKTFNVQVDAETAEAMMAAAVLEVRACNDRLMESRKQFGGPVITADTAEDRMYIEVRRQGCIRFLNAACNAGWPFASTYLNRAMER